MPGGKAMRRRAKLAERANQGNLHKAAKGKAGASAHLPLPAAPTQEDYKEKVPASLARMMALKAAASQPTKKAKLDTAQLQQPKQSQKQHQQQKPAQQQQADGQPAGATADYLGSEAVADADAGLRAVTGKAAAAAAAKPEAPKGGLIWEQPKKLKQRKKEYLNAKKLKKKGKKGAAADQDVFAVDKPAFGEVVHQPPKVHLKSKHWDPAAAAAAVAAGSNAGQKSRAKQQQLHQSQQQQQQQKKRKQQQQHQQQGKAAKKAKQDPAMQQLRDQVIEGYRAGRGPREGHATLDTLKNLVQKQ